ALFPRSMVLQSAQRRRSSGDRTGDQRNKGVRAEKRKTEAKVEEEVFVQELTDDDIARLVKIDPAQKLTDNDLKQVTEAWEEIGLAQTTYRVIKHWGAITKWLNTPPRTIRYMDEEQSITLREQIIAALQAAPFGITKERAEELTAGLVSVE